MKFNKYCLSLNARFKFTCELTPGKHEIGFKMLNYRFRKKMRNVIFIDPSTKVNLAENLAIFWSYK